MTALKPEHLQLDGAKPAGPVTPLRRSGGFFRRHRRPSASSSTVSSTPTFFSSTRSRWLHFPVASPSESSSASACGCPCRHHQQHQPLPPPPREADALLCCLASLFRRRPEPEAMCACGGCSQDCLFLARGITMRSSHHCLIDTSANNSSSGASGHRHEEDFALLDLRPLPPLLPPRRRHHSLGSAHAWVHPGVTLQHGSGGGGGGGSGDALLPASVGPPPLPPRSTQAAWLPRCLEGVHKCPFYWGRMDARRAEAALAQAKTGTYLLRDSSHADYLFTLSYRWGSEIKHLRVEAVKHNLFALSAHAHFAFACPAELVTFYSDHRLHLDGTAVLLQPLARSFAFSLSTLCCVVVCSRTRRSTDLDQLHLPAPVVANLRSFCQPLIPVTRPKLPSHHPR